ncbi:MAG TPA: hypothetical protein VEC37_10260 [Bacillota bacterium]|nr:hypothetical protein [Bacillota bacterium]
MSATPRLSLVRIDYNSATPELRARFHLNRQRIEAIYSQNLVPEETVILSTCNRTEFYFWGTGMAEHEFSYLKSIYQEEINPQGFYYTSGETVLLHLLELAVGLKSMLVGETEILGQIETAWQIAGGFGEKRLFLGELFKKAVVAARRIRRQTMIGGYSTSLYTLVLKELKRQGNTLGQRSALILGNGEVGQKLARAFCYQNIPTTILTRARDSKKRVKPCNLVEGVTTVFGYEFLEALIAQHDTIITATTAPHYIIKPEQCQWLEQKVVIDLAFPRNVDPEIGNLNNCVLWDLEYFARLETENQQEKAKAIEAAQELCRQAQQRIGVTSGARGPVYLKEIQCSGN